VEARDTSVERKHGESPASDAPPAPVTPDEARQPAIVSSWLLLALENAPLARGQDDTATLETVDGIADVAGGPETADVAAPLAGAVTSDVVGVATMPAPPIATGNPPAIPGAVATALQPVGSAPAGSRTASTQIGQTLQVEIPSSGEHVPSPLIPAQVDAADRDAAAGTPAFDAVPPDAVARWRAAQATGRAVDVPVADAASDMPSAEERTGIAAPGTVAHRLVQLVGRSADTGDSNGPTPPLVGIDAPGAQPSSTPTLRATEILQRLAQSAGDTGRRMHQDTGAANAAPFAASLASSLAPLAPDAAFAGVMEAAAVPSLPPAVGEQVASQIVASVRMQWKEGIGEAKLHLRPEGLGSVTVALRVEQGAVTAVVRADSAQVQDWVLQHQQTLRQQMEAAGLHLDELMVSPDDRGGHERHQDAPPERRRRQPRSTDASPDAPRFELLA
jgi:flagellar hook-length control protein FliK